MEDQQRNVASTAKLVVRPNFTRHALYHGQRPSTPLPQLFLLLPCRARRPLSIIGDASGLASQPRHKAFASKLVRAL